MKKLMLKQISVVVLIVVATFISSCGESASNGENDQKESKTEKVHEHIFSCPMHPEIKGKEGDTCSKCGMNLEMEDHEH